MRALATTHQLAQLELLSPRSAHCVTCITRSVKNMQVKAHWQRSAALTVLCTDGLLHPEFSDLCAGPSRDWSTGA